ncbi:MAG: hypothetical protein WA892_03605 [Ornithinimicrobium sp.]
MTGRWLVHGGSGTRCPRPSGWTTVEIADAAAAREPARTGAFRASLVLTVLDNGGETFGRWQAGADRALPVALADYELVDLRRCTVAGRPGGQRVARHRARDGTMLMLHQWFCALDGAGTTLSATCDVRMYREMSEHAYAAAAGLLLPARGVPSASFVR